MQSTLTPTETDPHDIFVIEPDVVLAARADHTPATETPANPVHEILSRPSAAQANAASDIVAAASVPAVDTTFRAAAADTIEAPGIEVPRDIHLPGDPPSWGRWARRAIFGFLFALGSAAAAEAWDHYGNAAKAMIAEWAPPPFGVVSSPPVEKPGATVQASAPDVQGSSPGTSQGTSQASASDQAATQAAAPAQPAQDTATASTATAGTAAAVAASPPQPMAPDLAAMGQQIEQLKASIEQLRAGQEQITQQLAQQTARNAQAKTVASPRPKLSALPPQPVAAPRKPRPAFSPAMTAAALAQPRAAMPPQAVYTQTPQPAPTPYDPRAQVIDRADGDPVERPPMPLR
jgi:hypothetical protein